MQGGENPRDTNIPQPGLLPDPTPTDRSFLSQPRPLAVHGVVPHGPLVATQFCRTRQDAVPFQATPSNPMFPTPTQVGTKRRLPTRVGAVEAPADYLPECDPRYLAVAPQTELAPGEPGRGGGDTGTRNLHSEHRDLEGNRTRQRGHTDRPPAASQGVMAVGSSCKW